MRSGQPSLSLNLFPMQLDELQNWNFEPDNLFSESYDLEITMGQILYVQDDHSPGPLARRHGSRRRKGFRRAEGLNQMNFEESSESRTIAGDRSTGVRPESSRIGAKDNSRIEMVRRTPSRNPSMTDHTQPSRYQIDIVLDGPGG